MSPPAQSLYRSLKLSEFHRGCHHFGRGGHKGEGEDLKDWEVSSLGVNDVKFPPKSIRIFFFKKKAIYTPRSMLPV